jgi:hypothetical protein
MTFLDQFQIQEKKRPCWDQPKELIKLILDKRKVHYNNDLNDNYQAPIMQKR